MRSRSPKKRRVGQDQQCVGAVLGDGFERGIEHCGRARFDPARAHAEAGGHGADPVEHFCVRGVCRRQHGNAPRARQGFVQQLHMLEGQFVGLADDAGSVAAWPRQARHQAGADRVGRSHEHDWNGLGGRLRRAHRRRCHQDEHRGAALQRLLHQRGEALKLAFCIQHIDHVVPAFDEAVDAQAVLEGADPGRALRRTDRGNKNDARQRRLRRRLLGRCKARCAECAGAQCQQQLAARGDAITHALVGEIVHSIPLSAVR